MAKGLSPDSDDLLTLLAQEPLGSRSSRDDDDDASDDDDSDDSDDDSSDDDDSDDDDSSEDSSSSSSGSARDDDDDDKDDDDSSSGSGRDDDEDFILIDGVLVKLRGDGSIDDSQPSGLTQTSGGFKLRGDGTVDDSQPGDLRVVGTRRDDTIIGPGVTRETLLGLKGSDDFVLGNRRDPFYEDSGKDRSYAILKDFSGKDEVVLHGSRSDYQISNTKESGVKGTGIFYKSDDGKDLVALIAGKGNLGNGALDFL
ncbi:MAG: hypothetical protein VKM34_08695 [Cyanobacteriota bacterium]|nr:hypothetical protein [Cyanobacteriota bacterium]